MTTAQAPCQPGTEDELHVLSQLFPDSQRFLPEGKSHQEITAEMMRALLQEVRGTP